jgi:hypothetical protein
LRHERPLRALCADYAGIKDFIVQRRDAAIDCGDDLA